MWIDKVDHKIGGHQSFSYPCGWSKAMPCEKIRCRLVGLLCVKSRKLEHSVRAISIFWPRSKLVGLVSDC